MREGACADLSARLLLLPTAIGLELLVYETRDLNLVVSCLLQGARGEPGPPGVKCRHALHLVMLVKPSV